MEELSSCHRNHSLQNLEGVSQEQFAYRCSRTGVLNRGNVGAMLGHLAMPVSSLLTAHMAHCHLARSVLSGRLRHLLPGRVSWCRMLPLQCTRSLERRESEITLVPLPLEDGWQHFTVFACLIFPCMYSC